MKRGREKSREERMEDTHVGTCRKLVGPVVVVQRLQHHNRTHQPRPHLCPLLCAWPRDFWSEPEGVRLKMQHLNRWEGGRDGWMEGGREGWMEGGMDGGRE